MSICSNISVLNCFVLQFGQKPQFQPRQKSLHYFYFFQSRKKNTAIPLAKLAFLERGRIGTIREGPTPDAAKTCFICRPTFPNWPFIVSCPLVSLPHSSINKFQSSKLCSPHCRPCVMLTPYIYISTSPPLHHFHTQEGVRLLPLSAACSQVLTCPTKTISQHNDIF